MITRPVLTKRNSQGKIWVNVASSHLVLEDFINLDRSVFLTMVPALPILRHVLSPPHVRAVERLQAARQKAPLVQHDCRRPLPFAEGTVDHILCSHYLEHLPPPTAEKALADYARVLRPGGTLHVVLPDLRYSIDRYVKGRIDADEMLTSQLMRRPRGMSRRARIMEAVGGLGLEHQWMYDIRTAERKITAAGFKTNQIPTPSSSHRQDDPESLHLIGVRP